MTITDRIIQANDIYVIISTTLGAVLGPISQRDLCPDLDVNLRLWP